MKFKKQTALLLSFTVGALLVATTALADMTHKSGYDQLKDALKNTAAQCSSKFDNFTMDISYVVKDNGKTVSSSDTVRKMDRKADATLEETELVTQDGGRQTSEHYADPQTMIDHSSQNSTYFVTHFDPARKFEVLSDPFQSKGAGDVERIVDAVVGNLKDYVVVKESPNGSKEFSGSLNQTQIPSLINALVSFQAKRGLVHSLPQLTQDIFIKEIKGNAQVNRNGVMQSLLGTLVMSGKDAQGQVHLISLEVLGKLSGINATQVVKPDLGGKKVQENTVSSATYKQQIVNPKMYVGEFKNDIVIQKDGKFVKAGERILDITQADQQTVTGQYKEEYKPGFESYATHKVNFHFKAKLSPQGPPGGKFSAVSANGDRISGQLYFDPNLGKVNLVLNGMASMGPGYDSTFEPVFH
ncbi:Hypothetical protein DEACI_0900 [Acididesulfobacillus acetoxydans]|uniref:Conserved protein n=1 Tax=Acididesulfobacillus acetoxydans TaxID=1561005 RepID=A0A8S0W217_9FIRM|nr:hypothetical protein [Acididesulfobacillus acetoxydans]CAA7600248.1 Hypothetical protein DEACI_0900 [Acididesulfobacillus acetoxydans]CEJ09626.1 Conserved protein [Acididesulfobacillus acetoxydans]